MLVILKKGTQIWTIENVILEDAHKPTVNGEAPIPETDDPGDTFKYIEYTLWFKTYMVSAIYIDCDTRDVVWYRCDIEPFHLQSVELLKGRPPNGQRLFDDIYDYDPIIDELTDRAVNVMDLFSDGNISKTKLTTEVVRILHCYILPSLQLTSLDIDKLIKASERVEQLLKDTEGHIVSKGKSVDLSSNSLDKQRHRLLKNENMHVESYVRSCNRDFLSFFLLHIEKDIVNLDSHLMHQQQQINKLRDEKSDVDDKLETELKVLRTDRDVALYNLEKLQIVRENIKNITSRQSKIKRTKTQNKIRQNVFHDIYRELSICLQEQKEEMHKLVLKKLKMTTVREAINNSLKELHRDRKDSKMRTSFTDGSEYSLDVMNSGQRPESWMTIDDKIKKALSYCDNEIFRTHTDGVSMMIEKTDAALSEMLQFGYHIEFGDNLSGRSRISTFTSQKDYTRTLSTDSGEVYLRSLDENESKLIQNMGESSRKRRSQAQSLSESICEDMSNLLTSSLKRYLGDIGQDFRNHIERMCTLFMSYIPEIEQRHFNKLWIRYECILCELVIDKLSELYIGVYQRPCHTLYKSSLKFLDPTCYASTQSLISVQTPSDDTFCGHQLSESPYARSSKSVEQCYKEALDNLLSPAMVFIKDAIAAKPLLEKLRRLTKAFRFMNDQLVKLNSGQNNACCDDLLTITTALILDLDSDLFTQLYATVNLLIDLKAPFLSGGVHDFCLTHFFSAYHYLFDKQVLQRRELSGTTC